MGPHSDVRPVPFEITRQGDARVASNGRASMTVLEPEADLFKRRAVKGLDMKPAGEVALPLINGLAGEVLANLGMPVSVLAERLQDIIQKIQPSAPQPVEWAVARLDGVSVYFDGESVVVTRQDMRP